MMPGITGYEVCKRIKTNPDIADTKVLILTAKGQQSDEEAAWEALADFYLAKPFSPMELLSMVEEVLSVFARKKRQFIGGKSRPI
jgi:DNA-binding response OmpR family regulator